MASFKIELPQTYSSSTIVQNKRMKNPRWNERYQSDEIDKIFTTIAKSYDSTKNPVPKDGTRLLANLPMHRVVERLCEDLGRPMDGFLVKMFRLKLLRLNKDRRYFRGPKYFEFNSDYIESIKGKDGWLEY
jgi:hypothetical protein